MPIAAKPAKSPEEHRRASSSSPWEGLSSQSGEDGTVRCRNGRAAGYPQHRIKASVGSCKDQSSSITFSRSGQLEGIQYLPWNCGRSCLAKGAAAHPAVSTRRLARGAAGEVNGSNCRVADRRRRAGWSGEIKCQRQRSNTPHHPPPRRSPPATLEFPCSSASLFLAKRRWHRQATQRVGAASDKDARRRFLARFATWSTLSGDPIAAWTDGSRPGGREPACRALCP